MFHGLTRRFCVQSRTALCLFFGLFSLASPSSFILILMLVFFFFLLSRTAAVCLRLAFRNLARARPLASTQRVCAAMGPQPCPGPCTDGTLTELASETVRSKWAQSEGVKWEWRTSDVQHTKCAWWRLCVPCHRLACPLPPSFVQGAGGHSQKKEALAVKVLSQTTPAAAPQSRASYLRKPQ